MGVPCVVAREDALFVDPFAKVLAGKDGHESCQNRCWLQRPTEVKSGVGINQRRIMSEGLGRSLGFKLKGALSAVS